MKVLVGLLILSGIIIGDIWLMTHNYHITQFEAGMIAFGSVIFMFVGIIMIGMGDL